MRSHPKQFLRCSGSRSLDHLTCSSLHSLLAISPDELPPGSGSGGEALVLHRALFQHRPETNEERELKEEINLLKVDLKETEAKINDEHAKSLSEKISQLERDLELLTTELDDKIRFGQRPGSGAGRVAAPSPTNVAESSQITEPMERPRSRGGIEQYPKPMEERWGFQGSRDRSSFGGNRSSDRSTAGQRW